jgi:hypothetical protein
MLRLKGNRTLTSMKRVYTNQLTSLFVSQYLQKVKKERITWALLDHPNILPLLGYIENDPYFGELGALVSPVSIYGTSSTRTDTLNSGVWTVILGGGYRI